MNRSQAWWALRSGHNDEGGVPHEHASALLDLARDYGSVTLPHVWDGPDSWHTDIQLTVSYLDEGKCYTVDFSTRERD